MLSFRQITVAVCCAAAGVVAIGQTAHAQGRVTPGPGEVLKVEQVIILSDVSGSTGEGGSAIFDLEKKLVNDFVALMPDMVYQAGFSSFAGGSQDEWTRVGLRNGTLNEMTAAAASYEFLAGSTPLRGAVEIVGAEFRPQAGRSALVVFSDGKSATNQPIINACSAINEAQNGNLCVYTVNIGSSEEGRMVLEKMAGATGCGMAWQASDLESAAGMETAVREVFFGPASRTVVLSAEVLFDFDKATLKPAGREAINVLVADMKASPNDRVAVEGHTCDIGTAEYNMGLSQRRANAVKAYMVNQGIEKGRISTAGLGETRPAVPNTSSENRSLNRRAEFKFTTTR